MGTDSLSLTEGAAIAGSNSELSRPVGNDGLPAVWVTSWTFIALPPDLPAVASCDNNVAKVEVLGMVPLALQQGVQAADVWALLLLLLLLSC